MAYDGYYPYHPFHYTPLPEYLSHQTLHYPHPTSAYQYHPYFAEQGHGHGNGGYGPPCSCQDATDLTREQQHHHQLHGHHHHLLHLHHASHHAHPGHGDYGHIGHHGGHHHAHHGHECHCGGHHGGHHVGHHYGGHHGGHHHSHHSHHLPAPAPEEPVNNNWYYLPPGRVPPPEARGARIWHGRSSSEVARDAAFSGANDPRPVKPAGAKPSDTFWVVCVVDGRTFPVSFATIDGNDEWKGYWHHEPSGRFIFYRTDDYRKTDAEDSD